MSRPPWGGAAKLNSGESPSPPLQLYPSCLHPAIQLSSVRLSSLAAQYNHLGRSRPDKNLRGRALASVFFHFPKLLGGSRCCLGGMPLLSSSSKGVLLCSGRGTIGLCGWTGGQSKGEREGGGRDVPALSALPLQDLRKTGKEAGHRLPRDNFTAPRSK